MPKGVRYSCKLGQSVLMFFFFKKKRFGQEPDHRLWRTIHVCMGAEPSEQILMPKHSNHPSVVDIPNMETVFDKIYSILLNVGRGKKYVQKKKQRDLCNFFFSKKV